VVVVVAGCTPYLFRVDYYYMTFISMDTEENNVFRSADLHQPISEHVLRLVDQVTVNSERISVGVREHNVCVHSIYFQLFLDSQDILSRSSSAIESLYQMRLHSAARSIVHIGKLAG
jgi:hypothetical protein